MLVINGLKVPVLGLSSSSFLENPKLGFTDKKDYGLRKTSWVHSICVHTRMGIWPQPIGAAGSDRHWDELGVKNASNDDRIASWHLSIDSDGSFVCHLDLAKHKAYHVSQCNEHSIGIEMYQTADGVVTNETLESCVKIIDVITREFKIQRQFAAETGLCRRFASGKKTTSKSASSRLAYMAGGLSGEDFVGVFGHRNATGNRGRGDPGDMIFKLLEDACYEKFLVDKDEDLTTWKVRQARLGLVAPHDGVPGLDTVRAIEAGTQAHGLWLPRPCDI